MVPVPDSLAESMNALSSTQRNAADWAEGACLVLAGPGVGKTTVLTTRIARLLDSSRKRNFRILALTFTIKAGDEMRRRVETLVPGLVERTTIGTFHSFCAQILRQHGSHIGIKPDFGVYDQDADRTELLRAALAEAEAAGKPVAQEDSKWLKTVDQLRAKIVGPKKTAQQFLDVRVGERIARVYAIYEQALSDANVNDFNGLILDACRLVHKFPSVAARIRQTYPYWMIDEFQDTSPAQYRFIRFLAGEEFRNVFAVADDDQIIYQWAGASYKQLTRFREDFAPAEIQIVENRRCPPGVVKLANNLVSHNSERTPGKSPLVATKPASNNSIDIHVFESDIAEATGVAEKIASTSVAQRAQTAVLARTRSILEPILKQLRSRGVTAAIAARRDRYISPQFVWLQALLELAIRPADRRTFFSLCNAANRTAKQELDPAFLAAEAEASGKGFLDAWASAMHATNDPTSTRLADMAQRLIRSRDSWPSVMREGIDWLPTTAADTSGVVSDAADDRAAWECALREIKSESGPDLELSEMLQCLALRPKEPPPDPSSVTLSTIHSAKGLEFDIVWVVGLADSILPSWQSLKPDAVPSAVEEERRNCFVAITRCRKKLELSRANSYGGWSKKPSRFLEEMSIDGD
jgi:DNA helicase II / ATP-dependent DNA helicase PcrA